VEPASLSLSPASRNRWERVSHCWVGDAPETSLHEALSTSPVSGVPTKPSLSALHRCPWQARQGRADRGQASRSFVHRSPSLGACTVVYCIALCAPTIRLHTVLSCAVQSCFETPLPLHAQSLILTSAAARRTPITLSPPLSLHTDQITSPQPRFRDQRRRDKPSTVLPRGHVPCRAPTSTSRRKSTADLDWDSCTSTAAVLCARYGPELLGGRAVHFIRPFRATGRGPYTLE
jgi:hypothetical protein